MNRLISVALTTVLAFGLTAAATGTGNGNGNGRSPKPKPTATLTGAALVKSVHDSLCPVVMDYPSCLTMTVTIADSGPTGYTGSSGPANNTVEYNTYYTLSEQGWRNVVAHEVGGHVDTWNELVARAGVSQAWIDYYDINQAAKPWMEKRWFDTFGTERVFTTGESKEMWLDCAGPVKYGYRGAYLYNRGIVDQAAFCRDHASVLESVLTIP